MSGRWNEVGSNANATSRNYLCVTADMASATWYTAATHEVFTVTGVDLHFSECGHVMESKDAGTNVLVLCSIHFN